MIHIDAGRLKVNEQLSSGGFGVNVGCGHTKYPNKVNVDVSRKKSEPDVLASALQLPFRNGCFSEVIFTEVLEHVPAGSEVQAFQELKRILRSDGQIVFSTPNKTWLAVLLDPMVPLIRHRHYSISSLHFMIKKASLNAHKTFTSGKLPMGNVTLAYALNWLLLRREYRFFSGLCSRAFRFTCGEKGSTVFMVIRNESAVS